MFTVHFVIIYYACKAFIFCYFFFRAHPDMFHVILLELLDIIPNASSTVGFWVSYTASTTLMVGLQLVNWFD